MNTENNQNQIDQSQSVLAPVLGAALAVAGLLLAHGLAHAAPAADFVRSEGLAASAAPRPKMGWFGIGIRGGVNHLSLSAGPAIALVGGEEGESLVAVAPELIRSMDLDTRLRVLTPTLHFGGDGYFFKLEAPIGRSNDLDLFGLGLYPINVGVYFSGAQIMPTISVGGVVSYARSRTVGEGGAAGVAVGAVVEGKVGLGLKVFAVRGLAISIEGAFTPWAAGGVYDEHAAKVARQKAAAGQWLGVRPERIMRGGIGSGWEITVGAQWL